MNERKTIQSNDATIATVRMQYGTQRSLEGIDYSDYTDYEKTENIGYVIQLKHKNILHQGDACLKTKQSPANVD